jgi:hypothetical protein
MPKGEFEMTETFQVGDHVSWNSEAGRVSGKIIKVHTSDFDYKDTPIALRRMTHALAEERPDRRSIYRHREQAEASLRLMATRFGVFLLTAMNRRSYGFVGSQRC